jgi:hypothetical protein
LRDKSVNTGTTEATLIYVLDEVDRIVSLNENWLAFAKGNNASLSCHPDRIINTSIWLYVDGIETKYLYDIIMKYVRESGASVSFPFRCDAPDRRRYLEMTISYMNYGRLEFATRLMREELRDPVDLITPDFPRSEEILIICSLCKRVELPGQRWEEVEAAITELELFDNPQLPMISHGLCPECLSHAMSKVEDITKYQLRIHPLKTDI